RERTYNRERLNNLLKDFTIKNITFIKESGNHWILCDRKDLEESKIRGNVQITMVRRRMKKLEGNNE
ncbi:unnamed protein product, partial [marine sediment metagenome]